MPRSSVFVRLNWPSKSDDSSFESEGSPHVQGTLPSSASYPYAEKTASSSSGDSFERKTPDLESNALSSFSPSPGNIRGEKYTKNIASTQVKIKCHAKLSVEKGTEPSHWLEGIQPSSSCTAAVPSYYGNQSIGSTIGSCGQHSDKICHTVTTDTVSNAGGAIGICKKVGTGSLKVTKPKTKPKPRHLANKNRRISRSLSASCVSVSTNTDPRDFVELAKVSATLPIRRRLKDPKTIAARSTENKAVSCSLDLEDICQAENSFESKTENEDYPVAVKETFFQKIVYPCAHTPYSNPLPVSKDKRNKCEDDYQPTYSYSIPNSPTVHDKPLTIASGEYKYHLAYSGSLPNTPTVHDKPITVVGGEHIYQLACSRSLPNSPSVHEKPIIPPNECYTVDNGDETIRGYIELPTYIPSGIHHPCTSNNDGMVASCTVLQDDKHPILSLLSNTLDKLSLEDAPYIDDEMFTALGAQQDLAESMPNVHSDEKDEIVLNMSLDDGGFQQKSISWSELDCNLKDQLASSSSTVVPDTTPTLIVHHCSFPQDKLDLVPESSEFSWKLNVGNFIKECGKQDAAAKKGYLGNDEETFPPIHWSPIPKHHLLQAAARRHLEKDISIESCPDVVLQTLESEGVLMPKSHKKTVTFLLPPEHWDSLISLRENNLGGYPQSGYAELDSALLPPNGQDPYRNTPSPGLHGVPQDRYVQWRDPDLHEVIDFLSNPNNVVKANAAAYLQHLCYMDDPTKQKTRILGGIPPLVALLSHDLPELHRNACGALRNLSYGRQNDENKRAIKDASGIPALVRLLRKTPDNEIKELVTGILWNLSSCEDLKHSIIDDALTVTVSHVIIPCSGWDGGEVERDPNVDVWWSTVFKNASGVLRNVSSAGEYARTKLRQCHGLVDSLLTVIKSAIAGASHDNKSVENCVCILRNLSYRCQEVEDPNYDKNQPPTQSRATATAKDGEGDGTDTCGRSSEPKDNLCDNLGCFGGSRKKKEAVGGAMKETSTGQRSTGPRTEPLRGMELLWQPEVVVGPYLALLSDCSNPETLEAAAGALQNLAACYWQPSIDVRAAVRKEKGLPILVELLRMEVDRVVCAVATALRNLAIDQRNKELIGKYAMRELVQKLPSGNTHDTGTSDETIAAVLATLNEVIKKNAEFSRSLLDFGGVDRLVNMTRLRGRYSVRVVKFASQVLFSMWGHQELREVYKKQGWKEQDFVSKSVAARNASGGGANSPTANNTLNRPMASQGGTRYEDKTIQRGQGKAHQQREQLPMSDMGYGGDGGIVPQAGGVRLYPPVQGKPGEPVYAKVNRDKKRNRQYDGLGPQYGTLGADDWSGPVYSGSPTATPNFNTSHNNNNNTNNNGVVLDSAEGQAGDSWV